MCGGVEEKSRRSNKLHMLSHRNMMRVMSIRFLDLDPWTDWSVWAGGWASWVARAVIGWVSLVR
jgi:hypothetical protein